MKPISKIQQIQFELMKLSSFNEFNGNHVVADLEGNPDIWKGAIFTRDNSLIALRDISSNIWNADTLYITSVKGKEEELMAMAQNWDADEISWMGGWDAIQMLGEGSPEAKSDQRRLILRVWWD